MPKVEVTPYQRKAGMNMIRVRVLPKSRIVRPSPRLSAALNQLVCRVAIPPNGLLADHSFPVQQVSLLRETPPTRIPDTRIDGGGADG